MHATGLKYSKISNILTQGVLKHPPVTTVAATTAVQATVTAVTTAITMAKRNSKKINNSENDRGWRESGA